MTEPEVSGPSTPEPRVPQPRTNVAHLLETATQLFRLTLPKCLPLAMVAMLCVEVPNLYWISQGHALESGLPSDRTYWLLALISAVVTLYVASAMMLKQRSLIAGTPWSSVVALRAAAQRLPLLLVTWLLAQVSLLVGFSLLVLPCVFLSVCYLLMLPVVLFERANPYMVLVRCVLLMRPYWWRTVGVIVIAGLVLVVCVLAFVAILGVMEALLAGPAFRAIATACIIAFLAAVLVFLSALVLTLYSAAANSSA